MNFNDFTVSDLENKLIELSDSSSKDDKKLFKEIDLYLCSLDNHRYEKKYYKQGYSFIAGVDEVGRGPLVGPVVAAAVILPKDYNLSGLTDSKKLSEKKREYFYDIIMKEAISVGIGIVDNTIIDEINIYEATKMAMKEAISSLKTKPDVVLTDAMKLDINIPLEPIIKGDLKSISISAASVIAKVTRDRMMNDLDMKYPFYNFKNNKGYPTKDHVAATNKYGILKEHRKSYSPIKNSDYKILN